MFCGFFKGQTFQAQLPDKRIINVTVPPNCAVGDTLLVDIPPL